MISSENRVRKPPANASQPLSERNSRYREISRSLPIYEAMHCIGNMRCRHVLVEEVRTDDSLDRRTFATVSRRQPAVARGEPIETNSEGIVSSPCARSSRRCSMMSSPGFILDGGYLGFEKLEACLISVIINIICNGQRPPYANIVF